MLSIVTVDPSMSNTGYARADGSTTCCSTKSDPDATGMRDHRHRLERERLVVARMIDLAEQDDADLLAVEGYAPNQQTNALYSGELGALIRDAADRSGRAWVVVAPSSRAKYATGKGNASKDTVLQATAARLGRTFHTSDECDAWLIWAMAHDAYGLPIPGADHWKVPQSHADALVGVDWPIVRKLTGPLAGFPAAPVTTYKPTAKKRKK